MKKVLLASHGRLALGLKDTLELFIGKMDNVVAVGAYLDSSDNYIQIIQDFIKDADENAVIFTDIYGGSVNQQVTRMVLESEKNITIITSMNLPIVLSVVLMEGAISTEDINQMLTDCMPSLVICKNDEEEGDIDEFLG